jgi:4-hydroxybenzoate polyprenyltransferase
MNLLKLFWRLLRYRVAVMLALFMLLTAAIHGGVSAHPWTLAAGALALAASYVSATSTNDLADRDIDAINHPTSIGRPLITGGAAPKDMWRIFILASALAVVIGFLMSLWAGIIMILSISVNILYSLPPFRLSYRTFIAPISLGIAYVGVPYFLALALTESRFGPSDLGWFVGLYFLFIGRIILKDFRDRKGDRKFHKPTFLLQYGKTATCLFSLVCLVIGGGLVISKIISSGWVVVVTLVYLLAIASMLYRLYLSDDSESEQISIGVGARLGNGLLVSLLAIEILIHAGSSIMVQQVTTILLAVAYLGSFVVFLRNPHEATVGYKG